jgi:hypothetical protein
MRDLPENEVRSWDDVPQFANEADEAAFWSTHGFGQEILDQMRPIGDDEDLPPARPRTELTLYLDDETMARLKALAQVKGKRYERLVKEFIVERLYEEEKRAGLVGQEQPNAAVGAPSPTVGS